jgi:hypothetical protein
MSSVLRPRSHSLPSGFARFVVQKFGQGPFLVIGRECDELERQFHAAQATATVFGSVTDLPPSLPNGVTARAGLAIWFYPRDNAGDADAAKALAAAAANVLLVPEPSGQNSGRRPELVRHFAEAGLVPDYDCDLGALEPGASAGPASEPAKALVPAVEAALIGSSGRSRPGAEPAHANV